MRRSSSSWRASRSDSAQLGCQLGFPGTDLSVARMGYGAMQLAGPGVFGPVANEDPAKLIDELAAEGIAFVPFFPIGGIQSDPVRDRQS
ncbi:hypothetical protein G6O69_10090 [Pseudenhygromyxa sp. WMMC2535]|nr:hypothetical protein [Pseudenhygromyxa sp. WMMC2535]NVB38182.1 hypothetical protein [Pseudenhygromyxa sp. WMMC2535]